MGTKQSPAETTEFFKHLAQHKEKTFCSYKHIIDCIDSALSHANYGELLNLLPYMQSGDGYYAFRYLGEARRIFRILSIISLEFKYNKTLFCSTCTSYEQLMEKYLLSLFAMRRITLNLSEASTSEAICFLQSQKLTPFAFYFMLKDELISSNHNTYEIILSIYKDFWCPQDHQQFLSLTAAHENKPD